VFCGARDGGRVVSLRGLPLRNGLCFGLFPEHNTWGNKDVSVRAGLLDSAYLVAVRLDDGVIRVGEREE
jgi:hypothetical protein